MLQCGARLLPGQDGFELGSVRLNERVEVHPRVQRGGMLESAVAIDDGQRRRARAHGRGHDEPTERDRSTCSASASQRIAIAPARVAGQMYELARGPLSQFRPGADSRAPGCQCAARLRIDSSPSRV